MTAESPAEHRGCPLAFRVEGSGPPVVLIQGVGVAGSGWAPQVRELRSRFQCLTFDNRGMGASQPAGAAITVGQMAEDALWLMTHLGWDSAHVVGHSLGGPVALEMALTRPERVRSLSLLCTLARGRDATALSWRMLWFGLRSSIGPRRARRRAFLEMVMPPEALRGVDRDRLAAELAPLFGHDLADQQPVALEQLAALRAYDASGRLGEISGIPALVMSAAHDPIAPPRHGRALADAIPGARFLQFDDASHGLPIQHAGRVNEILIDHLDQAESARAAGGGAGWSRLPAGRAGSILHTSSTSSRAMGTPLSQRIQDLLVSDTPSPAASLEEMIAWVHARENRFFSHAELVQALEELHRAGWIRSEGVAYALVGFDWSGDRPLVLPDEADLEYARERWLERMRTLGGH